MERPPGKMNTNPLVSRASSQVTETQKRLTLVNIDALLLKSQVSSDLGKITFHRIYKFITDKQSTEITNLQRSLS